MLCHKFFMFYLTKYRNSAKSSAIHIPYVADCPDVYRPIVHSHH